jgi:hypothetical protein
MRLALILRCIAAFAFLASPAGAQQLPGAGGFPVGSDGEGHGWVVIGDADQPDLIHLPPRGSVDVEGGRQITGRSGTVRLAARLLSMPEALACRGRELYLMFAPGPGERRLVLRASVRPGPVGNLWEVEQRERLDALPPLEAPGRLLGLVGSDLGLAALTDRDETAPELRILRGRAWERVSPPAELAGAASEVRLVALPTGIGLLAYGPGGGAALWRGEAGSPDSGAIRWMREDLNWPGGAPPPSQGLAWLAGGIVFSASGDGGVSLIQVRPSGPRMLAELKGVGRRIAICPLPASGRVALVWTEPKPGATEPEPGIASARRPEVSFFVREVSAHTGRILYDGPPAEAWPLSVVEFRLLAALLVAIVIGVLLFVLRPEQGDGVVMLPRYTALAPAWRRAVAGAIDVGIAWLIVSSALGVTLESLVLPVLGAKLVPVVLLVIGAGCAHSTIGEWAIGRSFGKLIAGCRVVRVGVTGQPGPGNERPQNPSFRSALARNVFRWAVPPLGIAGLASPGGRHGGDLMARTAVVVVVEPDENPHS